VEHLSQKLSDLQAEVLRNSFCSQLFAVVSWGCTATSWLAAVLNRHPDIFCVHGANMSWQVLGNVARLDGLPYMRVIGHQGQNHVAAGDVHGVSRNYIPELRRCLADRFNAVVVVREPISRIHSQLALFANLERYQTWDLGYVDGVISRAGITLPANNYRCRFFVHAANMLNAILEEQDVGRVYRSEDLTQRPEELGDLVEEITRGKVSPSEGWLRSAIEMPRVNVHADPHRDPQFEDWQVDVIRRVVDPRSWEIYEALAYPSWELVLQGAGSLD
jgi:hypothetical protein